MIVLSGAALLALAKDEQTPPATDENKMKPVAVISIASYDRIMSSIAYIGKLSNNPELDKNLEGMLKLFTQGQGVNGLDRTRPLGAAVSTDGMQFQPLVFVPVVKLQQLLDSLAPIAAIGEAKDIGNGVFELQNENMKLYVKEQSNWAFIAQVPESLANLPKDPSKLLGGLDTRYEVALRLHVQNIPDMYRTFVIDQIKAGVESGLERKEDEEDAQYELRKKQIENQVQSMVTAINETDRLTVGWKLDQDKNISYVDLRVTALPNTKSARQFAAVTKTRSRYTGFLVPDAAVTVNFAADIPKEDITQAGTMLEAFQAAAMEEIAQQDKLPDDATRKLAQEVVGELLGAVRATLDKGRADGGGAVVLDNHKLAVIAGGFVADPQAVERALHKVDKLAKEKDPKFPGVQFDADKHGDVRFHTLSIPITEKKEAVRLLGDPVQLAVGIGSDSVYLAFGADSLPKLKGVIDKSKSSGNKPVLPMQLSLALRPILEFAAAMEKQKAADNGDPVANGEDEEADQGAQAGNSRHMVLEALAAEVAKSEGKDHVRVTAHPIRNGMLYRLLAEEGVLKLLGQAGKLTGAGMPIGPQ